MLGTDIEFVHQSARDYLAGNRGQSILDTHEHYGHSEIALSCLSYLSKRLEVDLLELLRPGSTKESIKELKDEHRSVLLASVDYAATFWAQHLVAANGSVVIQSALTEHGPVCKFLRTRLLEWLECLSLLDKLPNAIVALKAITNTAEVSFFIHPIFRAIV